MADKVMNSRTSLGSDEVISQAVQAFTAGKFRTSSQSGRIATFDGMPPIPWFMLLLTILGFLFCVIPGIIMYFLVIRKMRRFHSLVVTVSPVPGGTDVSVKYPDWAGNTVQRFMNSLPKAQADLPPRL